MRYSTKNHKTTQKKTCNFFEYALTDAKRRTPQNPDKFLGSTSYMQGARQRFAGANGMNRRLCAKIRLLNICPAFPWPKGNWDSALMPVPKIP